MDQKSRLSEVGRALATLWDILSRAGAAFWRWLAHTVRIIREGQTPDLDGEDDIVIDVAPRSEPALQPVTTVVPSSRWTQLDEAIGKGGERWRNLAMAATVILALNVSLIVLWTAGESPAEDETWTTDPVAEAAVPGLAPELGLQPEESPSSAADELGADDLEEALAPPIVPSVVGFGGAEAVEEPAPQAPEVDLFATATEPVAETETETETVAVAVAVAVAETVAEPLAETEPVAGDDAGATPEVVEEIEVVDLVEVPSDDAQKLAKKAGCPTGTLPTRVLPGDTVKTIAWRHAGAQGRKLIPKILESNPRLKPERMFPGDLVCVPDVERVIVEYDEEAYTIRRGDTIGGLAARFGHLTQQNVRALTSRVRKRDMLFAGEKVRVPMPRYASL